MKWIVIIALLAGVAWFVKEIVWRVKRDLASQGETAPAEPLTADQRSETAKQYQPQRKYDWELQMSAEHETELLQALCAIDIDDRVSMYLDFQEGVITLYEPPQVVALQKLATDWLARRSQATSATGSKEIVTQLFKHYGQQSQQGVLHLSNSWSDGYRRLYPQLDSNQLANTIYASHEHWLSEVRTGSSTSQESTGCAMFSVRVRNSELLELLNSQEELQGGDAQSQESEKLWQRRYDEEMRLTDYVFVGYREVLATTQTLRAEHPNDPLRRVFRRAIAKNIKEGIGTLWPTITPPAGVLEAIVSTFETRDQSDDEPSYKVIGMPMQGSDVNAKIAWPWVELFGPHALTWLSALFTARDDVVINKLHPEWAFCIFQTPKPMMVSLYRLANELGVPSRSLNENIARIKEIVDGFVVSESPGVIHIDAGWFEATKERFTTLEHEYQLEQWMRTITGYSNSELIEHSEFADGYWIVCVANQESQNVDYANFLDHWDNYHLSKKAHAHAVVFCVRRMAVEIAEQYKKSPSALKRTTVANALLQMLHKNNGVCWAKATPSQDELQRLVKFLTKARDNGDDDEHLEVK
jgi:hypothetical protein